MSQLNKIRQILGKGVFISGADIDTDRIIPARFMKCVTFDGLGEYAFYDVRFDGEGKRTDHPLNNPIYQTANILIAGVNFGCGSSREHAPQSLKKFGFDAIIAESFAEIFFGNSTGLGMPCVITDKSSIETLTKAIEYNPQTEIEIDIENLEIRFNKQSLPITLPSSAQEALISGKYDPLSELLSNLDSCRSKVADLYS